MTREEKAQEFARNCAEYNNLSIEVEHLLHTAFIAGYNEREDEEKILWHKASEELPPVDTEVVCKMKGVPYTEHFVCKWDGKYWWHWNDCGRGIKGWFGLNTEWEIVEWKEI